MGKKRSASNSEDIVPTKRPRWSRIAHGLLTVLWPGSEGASVQEPRAGAGVDADAVVVISPVAPEPPTLAAGRPTLYRSPTVPAPRDSKTTHTNQIYLLFQQIHHLDMPFSQFTGLCAYLYGILRLGYRVTTRDLDGFVRQYPNYTAQLGTLQEEQVAKNTSKLISYHEWFLSHRLQSRTATGILNEHELREIRSEHAYTFLRTEMSLEYIARRRHYGHA